MITQDEHFFISSVSLPISMAMAIWMSSQGQLLGTRTPMGREASGLSISFRKMPTESGSLVPPIWMETATWTFLRAKTKR